MGTQVRQYVDSSKEQIGSNFFSIQGAETLLFYIHRSFSIIGYSVSSMDLQPNSKGSLELIENSANHSCTHRNFCS